MTTPSPQPLFRIERGNQSVALFRTGITGDDAANEFSIVVSEYRGGQSGILLTAKQARDLGRAILDASET